MAGFDVISEDSLDQSEALRAGKSIRQDLMVHYDPFSYGKNGLAPLVTAPYGAYQNGSYYLIGGIPNTEEFPPLWYATVDNGLADWIEQVIEKNDWKSEDPRNEKQGGISILTKSILVKSALSFSKSPFSGFHNTVCENYL